MRVSREQMVANRARILDEASRLFRERGFDAVSVAEVMKAAGQTHGGFYGHFASKDDLVAQVVAHAMGGERSGDGSWRDVVDAYLSPLHRDDPADGCPTAAFAGLMRQQTPAARVALAVGLDRQIDRIAQTQPSGDPAARRRAAIGQWSAMVGAIVMARAIDDPALADELLRETRGWIERNNEAAEGNSA